MKITSTFIAAALTLTLTAQAAPIPTLQDQSMILAARAGGSSSLLSTAPDLPTGLKSLETGVTSGLNDVKLGFKDGEQFTKTGTSDASLEKLDTPTMIHSNSEIKKLDGTKTGDEIGETDPSVLPGTAAAPRSPGSTSKTDEKMKDKLLRKYQEFTGKISTFVAKQPNERAAQGEGQKFGTNKVKEKLKSLLDTFIKSTNKSKNTKSTNKSKKSRTKEGEEEGQTTETMSRSSSDASSSSDSTTSTGGVKNGAKKILDGFLKKFRKSDSSRHSSSRFSRQDSNSALGDCVGSTCGFLGKLLKEFD